ncbi:hypothetical protein [Thermococcus sp. ES12]|uniref:hypothetical protein n=1 Tax=Thermococcus sp. ES12 TaxID=1638246 RepID=UPI00142F99FC|nr:hypothetical protein [Thermococcus sp. ES12]NJE75897.1 hypothetical protein [Thermococcus sp. ES12]
MRRYLLAIALILVVFMAGCIGGSGSTNSPEKSEQQSEHTQSPVEGNQQEDWSYFEFETSGGDIGYSLNEGRLSKDGVDVYVLLIDEPAKFAKVNPVWEATMSDVWANSVVFQVDDGVHYFSIEDGEVEHRSMRVVGDLFDFMVLNEKSYLGLENGVLRLYNSEAKGYREKKGVISYALTMKDGEIIVVTASLDGIEVTRFSNEGEALQEAYTFDCPIFYLHHALVDDMPSGFYMATSCGLYYVDEDFSVHDSGLGDESWDIISNDNDESGAIVVYSEDTGGIMGVFYDPESGGFAHSALLEVDTKPDGASVSGLYLALLYGDTLYLYKLEEEGEYRLHGTIKLPEPAKDVKVATVENGVLEIGVAWDGGFTYMVGPLEGFEGTQELIWG